MNDKPLSVLGLFAIQTLFVLCGFCLLLVFCLFLTYVAGIPLALSLLFTIPVAIYIGFITWSVLRERSSVRALFKNNSRFVSISITCLLVLYSGIILALTTSILPNRKYPNRLAYQTKEFISNAQTIRNRHVYNDFFPSRMEIFDNYLNLTIHRIFYDEPSPGETITIPFFQYSVTTPSSDPLLLVFIEEYIEKSYAFKSVRPDPYIIDCGSNIGVSLLFFKHMYPDAQILSIEAGPATLEILKTNIKQNELTDVEVVGGALSNHKGTITFYSLGAGGVGNSSIFKRGQAVEVPAILLSDLVTKEVDLLKIDIEGAETEVMEDLFQSGKLTMIRQIILEYHHYYYSTDESLSAILSGLTEAGFGLQLSGNYHPPFRKDAPEAILIYAYRR